MTPGVSVVICCHNSARLLPETLAALDAQRFDHPIGFEVIVVDNGSTDRTAEVARAAWPAEKASLRVVREERLGLSHARFRGIREARHEIVSFIDDDNRVCDSWVRRVAHLMARHPRVGACGGWNRPAFDGELPSWFEVASYSYAIGRQGACAGDVTDSRGYLWGAGLSIRKAALTQLIRDGFVSRLRDRQGDELSSGGDTEICFALRLAGWRLWYDPDLQLHHYLPASRLSWSYARRLNAGFGKASVHLDPYEMALGPKVSDVRRSWAWRTAATLKQLLKYGWKFPLSRFRSMEGDPKALAIDQAASRLRELLRARRNYGLAVTEVARAPWRATRIDS
jgi:glycosyltransferase involved in cell wall biosynthesis